MRVIMTGGGTGGHLYPALSIAEELKSRSNCELLFIGTRQGLESRVVPERGFDFRSVWISGLHRRRIVKNLLFPLKMAVSLIQSMWIVTRFRPHIVIGTGGYVSWPVLTAAIMMRKKTLIQEQNRVPGLVIRTLAPWVDSIHVSFSESQKYFKHQEKVHNSGNPTRKDLDGILKRDAYRLFDLLPAKKTIFVFGGSQGSLAINQAILKMSDELMKNEDLQILWVVGPRWLNTIKEEIGDFKSRIKIVPFISDMGSAYAISDVVICRAGATSVAEITRLGIPAVFIPLATAAGGHQEKNARLLYRSRAAEMILETELHSNRLNQTVLSLIENPLRREEMKLKIRQFSRPEAAKSIVDDIFILAGCFK